MGDFNFGEKKDFGAKYKKMSVLNIIILTQIF